MTNKPVHAIPIARWPFVVVALIVVAVVVTLIVTRTDSADAGKADQGIEKTTTPQPADGCLGGTDPSAAVLSAQTAAPRTADGAAAFLATYLRWQGRDPRAGEPDAQAIGSKVWGSEVAADVREDAVTREAAKGAHMTVADKHYSVREVRGNRVLVAMTVDIADSQDQVGANAAVIAWLRFDDGRWIFEGYEDDLLTIAAADDNGAAFRAKLDAEGIPLQKAC